MPFHEYLGEKNKKAFLRREKFVEKMLSKCFYSKKTVLLQKTPVTFNLTFYPNFHSNTWVFANIRI